ncbi:MAG TPA: Uma2 family endonuclease [Fimbriiglobus sp.]|jgi:Uma2 family endonuclease
MPVLTKRKKRKVPFRTVAELLDDLGGIPLWRVCLDPAPGTATKRELLHWHHSTGRRYELVSRTVVEKPRMGFPESFLAAELIHLIKTFLESDDRGYVCAPDALIELMPRLVRGPDVCFTPWVLTPDGLVGTEPISKVIPELVVEILSSSNTPGEIRRKVKEYIEAGVKLVWVIDPQTRSAVAHTTADTATEIPETGTLTGGGVLPGFKLPLSKLFARLAKPPAKRKKK